MIETITLSTTRGHASFESLEQDVSKSCDAKLIDLFSGEVRKTLLQTAQVNVEVVLPFGDAQDNEYKAYYVVYFMFEGKLQAKQTKFKSEVPQLLKEAYTHLATQPSTRLKPED